MDKMKPTLRDQYPEIAAEWHPTKNDKTPDQYAPRSGKKVWWQCSKGHEWEAVVSGITLGSGCPYCAGRRPTAERNLLICRPKVAAEWHPKNDKGPDQYTFGSHAKVWWRCSQDPTHEWEATINSRTNVKSGCPYCAGFRPTTEHNLAICHPNIVKEWHPTKNKLAPDQYTPRSDKKVWWQCSKGHEWESTIGNRTGLGNGCPYCAGKLPTPERNLAVCRSEIAQEWHPTKNELTPDRYTPGSEKRVWWQCQEGHEWEATIKSRTGMNSGCPHCSVFGLTDGHNLAACYPEVAAEWHPKNDKGPDQYTPMSGQRVWWKCSKNGEHEWEATISNRAGTGTDCPHCPRRRPSPDNNVSICYPEVAKEWHPKNDESPECYPSCSHEKVWWQCSEGHEWEAIIKNRTVNQTQCSHCTQHGTSRAEQDALQFVQSQTEEEVLHRDKSLGFEVDIYIPSLKLAIEYTGLIWHSTKFHPNPKRHIVEKHDKCEAFGVRLITIFEDEWVHRRPVVESRLLSLLGKGQRKFARKLDCKPIDNKVARDFCQQYHLQGKGQSKVAYGLYEDETLLSVMTFSKGSFAKGGHTDWEVNRFCSKPGLNVVGGASRLFRHFIKDHKPPKVISYCDRRWGLGKVYEAMGMRPVSSTGPNYWYTKGAKRTHRFAYRKQELLRQFGGDSSYTERQLAEQQGLYRVYDAGSLKYEYLAPS